MCGLQEPTLLSQPLFQLFLVLYPLFHWERPCVFSSSYKALAFSSLKGFPNVLLCLKHAFASPMHAQYKSHTHSFISQLKCHLFKKRLFGVTNQNCSFSWLLYSIKYCLFPYHKRGPWFEMNGQIESDRSINVMTNYLYYFRQCVRLGKLCTDWDFPGFLS